MPTAPKIGLFGIPFDANSSYLRGTAEAPARIREAFQCDSSNTWAENGTDVAELLTDLGDVDLSAGSDAMASITDFVARTMQQGFMPLALGGDHSVTFAIVRALAGFHSDLTILHFDAHPDLYEEFQGNRYSHASPFARIMEARLARRLVQIGIRTMNAHQRQQSQRFGVETMEMKGWTGNLPALEAPVYISFDLDVLDPGCAPGVAHHEPGGMTTRQAIAAIQGLRVNVVGADIVELNPRRDPLGITGMVAAKMLKEIAAKMAEAGTS